MANIFWTKRDTNNRKGALESTWGFLHRLKISWTLVRRGLKIRSKFSATFRKFCIELPTRCTWKPNLTKHCQMGRNKWHNGADASRIRWRRIVNVNVTIEITSLVSEAPKHSELAMASHRAAFSGNTLLIATFSSYYYYYSESIARRKLYGSNTPQKCNKDLWASYISLQFKCRQLRRGRGGWGKGLITESQPVRVSHAERHQLHIQWRWLWTVPTGGGIATVGSPSIIRRLVDCRRRRKRNSQS